MSKFLKTAAVGLGLAASSASAVDQCSATCTTAAGVIMCTAYISGLVPTAMTPANIAGTATSCTTSVAMFPPNTRIIFMAAANTSLIGQSPYCSWIPVMINNMAPSENCLINGGAMGDGLPVELLEISVEDD